MPRQRKLKEHPASVFREGANVTFLDLALETRTQIYGYILEEDSPIAIQLTSHGFGDKNGHFDIARKGHHRINGHRGQRYDRRSGGYVPAPPSHMAVMFINRQVYEEACGVFYGNNKFQFSTMLAVEKFTKHLDIKRVKQLRHLEIVNQGYNPSAFSRALPMLQQADCLRTLHFHHDAFCQDKWRRKKHDVDKFASLCVKLAEHLHRSHNARNVTANVLDIVQIVPGNECWQCKYRARGGEDTQEAKDASINARLRSYIASNLGITETEDMRDYAVSARLKKR